MGIFLEGFAGGGKKEGQHVWKKCNLIEGTVTNPSITLNGDVANPTVSCDGVILDLVDESFFGGFAYTGAPTAFYFEYTNGVLYYASNGVKYVTTYDASTHTLTTDLNGTDLGTHSNSIFSYTGSKNVIVPDKDNVVDYVVNDDETTFPNGGMQDGYWYERVGEGLTPEMLGLTKMAFDKFSYSTNTGNRTYINIPHTLGIKPRIALIFADINKVTSVSGSVFVIFIPLVRIDGTTSTNLSNMALSRDDDSTLQQTTVKASANSFTNTYVQVYIDSTVTYFKAGVEYTIMTMG